MKLYKWLFVVIAFCFIANGCGKSITPMPDTQQHIEKPHPITSRKAIGGIRIAWDYTSLKKVSSSAKDERYCGYARVIQGRNNALICVYEADGNVVIVKSNDLGITWTAPIVVASKKDGVNMAVPDILELKDSSIFVCYNPRPAGNEPSKRFAIRTKKSYDGGNTWQDESLLYEADYRFENGCWEPSAIQLPNGEIQLFFANEGVYTNSTEQNISMFRSNDNGLTWTKKPEIVSFRAGKRDGMPSPLLLKNGNEIAFAIEDNGFGDFKPYVIKNTLTQNWSQPVDATSNRRTYALTEKIEEHIYAGAPYLRQLKTGETILSYQGTEGRINRTNFAEMKVVIGDENAQHFTRKSTPFNIPDNKSGLWNSLCVLNDNTVIALTSTNAFSGNTEIWMIKGHIIPELNAIQESLVIDGLMNEKGWKNTLPIFIGQKSATQVKAAVSYDKNNLYILANISDALVSTNASTLENNDGLSISIDAQNKSYEAPDKGIFNFFITADNQVLIKEGSNGKWVQKTNVSGFQSFVKRKQGGYFQEISIPWRVLGGKPVINTRIGLNMSLTENSGKSEADYVESIAGNIDSASYSWTTLLLK